MVGLKCLILFYSIISLTQNGCTTCHEVKVNSISDGPWVADLRYRVCGSYSGYSVALYRRNEFPASGGDGEREQFQAIYRTQNPDVNNIPIHLKWASDNHLIIRHDTRMGLHEAESKLMIIKAENTYQGVSIEYIPKPVIWGKEHHEIN
jgi:hypothetical protein